MRWSALLGAALLLAIAGGPLMAETDGAASKASRKDVSRKDAAAKNTATKSAAAKDSGKGDTAKAPAKKAAGKKTVVAKNPLKIPNSQVEPVAWHQVDGWTDDDHEAAFATFLGSCRAILRSSAKDRAGRGVTYNALYDICKRAVAAIPLDAAGARGFFEQNFRPVRIGPLGEPLAFFTGYYEPIVEGARLPSHEYVVPLYRRPGNLVTQRLRVAGKAGKLGKKVSKRIAPFYERAAIEDGALAGRELEICYLKNPIDGFFAEIQGSTRVRLEDGSVLRLNYASGNGHPYTAVGKFLIERNIVTKDEMSMQKIRDYMEAFPEEGRKLRRENKSYVFFRETDLGEFEEAIGAQGVTLTDGRSLAVDRRLHTYGMPFFVDAVLPIQSEKPDTHFRRLMIAQDTGGAIVGPARADIYLGAGEEAARAAGRFKHFGRMTMLVPNELSAGAAPLIPLPLSKPKDGEEAKAVEFVDVIDSPVDKVSESKAPEGKAPENKASESKPQTDASAGTPAKVAERVEKPAATAAALVSVPLPKARPLPRKP